MSFSINLRFLFPPLLNLIIFFMFLKSQDGNSWDVQDGTSKILLYPILKLHLWFVIPAVITPLLLFLLTPIRWLLNQLIHSRDQLIIKSWPFVGTWTRDAQGPRFTKWLKPLPSAATWLKATPIEMSEFTNVGLGFCYILQCQFRHFTDVTYYILKC